MDLGNIGNEAIKLVWAKERIAALLAAERRQEAIVCAKLHNLICEGTAFIAWDEVEKVQVAEDEIVQPAMETPIKSVIACCGGTVELMSDNDHEGVTRIQEEDPDLIARRIARLRELLQQAGMSQARADEFIQWAKEDEAFGRMDIIEKAAGAIRDLAREVGRWVSRERLDRIIQQAVGSSPAALIAWEKEMRRPIECLLHSIHNLGHAGAPEAVLAHVFDWVCEAGTLNRERIERVEEFASSLKCLPFSAASRVRHWQAFLDFTKHDAAPHWLAAQAWITELGDVGAVIE